MHGHVLNMTSISYDEMMQYELPNVTALPTLTFSGRARMEAERGGQTSTQDRKGNILLGTSAQ